MFTATPKVIKMKIKIIPFRIRFVQHFPTLQRRQSRILVIPTSILYKPFLRNHISIRCYFNFAAIKTIEIFIVSEECLLTVLYGVFSRVPRLFKRSAQTTRILIATQRHWWFIDRCWLDAWILMLCREDTPVLGILYRNFRFTDVFLHVLQFGLS